jgi:hypothetical protein
MPHHLVLWDGMDLLEFNQGNNKGFFTTYVRDFSQMLIVVPLKDEYAKKLTFLHKLIKSWVWKIIYQSINIPNICWRLMKMVECMED